MFCALIVYVASKNIRVALIVALAFVITMSVVNEQKIAEGFRDGLRDMGASDPENLAGYLYEDDPDAEELEEMESSIDEELANDLE